MRGVYSILLALVFPCILQAGQKLEVFQLENRDAETLVPVIAAALGPEVRVTADARTNSLIVSCPAEMQENLRIVIAQLDQREPNIAVEVVTLDIETEWAVKLGLTASSSLSEEDYTALLPLLVGNQHVTLAGRQQLVTRNNVPAQISLASSAVVHHPDESAPPAVTVLAVIPRLLGDEIIELKLAQVSSALTGSEMNGVGRVFSTVAMANGGAQIFRYNEENNLDRKLEIPIFPLGVQQSNKRFMQRIVIFHAKVTDYKDVSIE